MSMSPDLADPSQLMVGSKPSSPSKLPSRTEIYKTTEEETRKRPVDKYNAIKLTKSGIFGTFRPPQNFIGCDQANLEKTYSHE
jgi:hypothetical protein